ncbi:hypothetical protein LRX75_23160 [Rhizobium sp. DKSPLA3]|uniref:Uncharacterized protein n=1 Tax=Rhizobium quercicola TaxID=2901226 RepID=A0A9X1NVL7_9HYPH|nr:hypothetical protein [Rhizobium quercicola]MCD7111922.1 hypothetical protein [Rhizobium quercicola]
MAITKRNLLTGGAAAGGAIGAGVATMTLARQRASTPEALDDHVRKSDLLDSPFTSSSGYAMRLRDILDKADTALQLTSPFSPLTGGESTPQRKWAQLGISPRDFDASAGTGGDDTAAWQCAADAAMASGGKFDIQGKWRISVGRLNVGNEHFEIIGRGDLTLIADDAQVCGLEISRGNFTISGSMTVFGQYKSNYEHAVWMHNSTQLQSADLSKLVIVGTKGGLRVGDVASPGSITSEITVHMPRTYGVPRPLQVEGAQTYLSVVAPPCLSADGFGGDGAWNAQTFRAVTNIGSNLMIIGGEVIQPTSGSASDYLVEMRPCLQGRDLSWGRVTLSGVVIEGGGPFAVISNPLNLSGSNSANDKPFLKVIGCNGYHSQDNAPMIDVHAGFHGDIIFKDSDVWKNGAARAQPNILCHGNLAHVYVDDRGFGNGFRGALSGTVGGIVHFSKRMILEAYSIPSAALVSGTQEIRYLAKVTGGDLDRFADIYNAANGVLIVPAGGFEEIGIEIDLLYPANVNGFIHIFENGEELKARPFTSGIAAVSVKVHRPPANTVYTFALTVVAGAGAMPDPRAYRHVLVVEASC